MQAKCAAAREMLTTDLANATESFPILVALTRNGSVQPTHVFRKIVARLIARRSSVLVMTYTRSMRSGSIQPRWAKSCSIPGMRRRTAAASHTDR